MAASLASESRAKLDAQNPWPGLESYDERSQAFFSGRSAECAELCRRIVDEPVTVLFGKSGLGKTSLLRAGVFPRLREKGFLPILVRLRVNADSIPLIEQVQRALLAELDSQQIEHLEPKPEWSLWEYLHLPRFELWTKQNRLVHPVFVFDQFEELFTLGKAVPAEVASFSHALADLAENRLPAELSNDLDAGDPTERELDPHAMPYKVVITLREDFLPDLEGLRLTMTSLRRNRMRLLPLGPQQALEAVRNEKSAHLVPESIAKSIVDFLGAGGSSDSNEADAEVAASAVATVEPALLSLFCRGVNEQRKAAGKATFDEALIEGGKRSIVAEFYRTSLSDQSERVRRFIEEQLITEQGFRNSYSVADALEHGFLTGQELATLVDRRLLRLDHYLGVERVELTHDILTRAAREERERRREVDRIEVARRERRQLRRWVGAAGAVALFCLGMMLVALKGRAQAHQSKVKAETAEKAALSKEKAALSKAYAARSESKVDEDPRLALMLARKGLRTADTPEARAAVLHVAESVFPEYVLGEVELGAAAMAIALSQDGTRLAVVAGTTLSVWNLNATSPHKLWSDPHGAAEATGIVQNSRLAFSPNGQLLAIAKPDAVTLFVVDTGRRARADLPASEGNRVLAFSPEGRWLAAAGNGDGARLWDLNLPNPKPKQVSFGPHRLGELAVVDEDAKTLMGIAAGLALYRAEPARGQWKELPVAQCISPHSISLGGLHISATFQAKGCRFDATKGLADGAELPLEGLAIEDIAWSARGGAYVAEIPRRTLPQRTLIVGTEDEARKTQMKGVGLEGGALGEDVAVSEDALRLAVIDARHKIHVYSLDKAHPYMNRFGFGNRGVAPDGSWMAHFNPSSPPTRIEFVSLDPGRTGGASQLIPSLDVSEPNLEYELVATNTSVVFKARGRTYLVDVRTKRELQFDGEFRVLGSERAIALAGGPAAPSLVRTRDGSEISWKRCEAGSTVVKVSASTSMLATICRQGDSGSPRTATVYAVRGEDLSELGKIVDLSTGALITIGNNGAVRTTQLRSGRVFKRTTWTVNSARPISASLDGAPQVPAEPTSEEPQWEESPRGGYTVLRRPSHDDEQDGSLEIRTKAGQLVTLATGARDFVFSDDERRLAVWSASNLQVFDLSAGATLVLNVAFDDREIEQAWFEARDHFVSLVSRSKQLLVPIDPEFLDRFATWLIGSRTMTHDEICANQPEPDENCVQKLALTVSHVKPAASSSQGASGAEP